MATTPAKDIQLEDYRVPKMPTATRVRYGDGRVLPVGGGLWLYRKAPLAPVKDAKTHAKALDVGDPIAAAIEELAAETPYTTARRSMARARYRPFHLLLVNLPRRYSPPESSRHADTLQDWFRDERTQDRLLLMGTKLNDVVGGADRTISDVIDSVATSMTTYEVPMGDYQQDLDDVSDMMTRSGFTIPTPRDFHLAESWWAAGGSTGASLLPHADHLHVFRTVAGSQTAARHDVENCTTWPTGIEGHHVLRMGSIYGLDLPFQGAANALSTWATTLLDRGAVMVSIRGLIEPSPITRKELRRQRDRYLRDIRNARAQGKLDDQQQEEMVQTLEQVEGAYSTGKAFPTLVETSVVAAFTGQGKKRLDTLGNGTAFEVAPMDNRQPLALAESWIGSPVRANPNLMDLPSSAVAYSGIASLATVGDASGANVGFTLSDRQEALMSATASSDTDTYPVGCVVGSSGAGKSQFMAYTAYQYALEGRPVIVIDPKKDSDFSESFGEHGTTFSLDSFAGDSAGLGGAGGTGVFDPLRFSKTPGDGINTAVSMLHAVNLWPHSVQNFEADLQEALKYGVACGAKAIGTALETALVDGKATAELVDPILRQSRNDPLFGAMVGLSDDGHVLSAAEGITYIKVGNANLELPPMGVDQTTLGLTQRVSSALIRMMVFGSAEALRGRRGVLMLDEAWVFLGAGAEEMERLGRLARSLEVFPILFTQRISDLIEANLTNHIARGIILHTKDPKEAEAAFRLFGVEPTPERLRFTTAPERIGKGGANFGSRKPLFEYDDKDNRVRLIRGAIGLYCDLDDRAVDVEIKIPADFLAKSSTNALDRARREGRAVI
ncbi:ATP-binding protein [Brachybacterium atlanticum]|uniref:ATP-binding protein n=1 Tax=Brachybacterium atlanticum TaxID=2911888 RepID=UPI0021E0612C|nr:ATP-binding protein [Brachybacterium atlanticum]